MKKTTAQILFLFLLSAGWSCGNSAEAGNDRGWAQSRGYQQEVVQILINENVPDAASIRQALQTELEKAGQLNMVRIQMVSGEPIDGRYLVVVGSEVPPSLLMRIKKAVLQTAASSASFRANDTETPAQVYIGKKI